MKSKIKSSSTLRAFVLAGSIAALLSLQSAKANTLYWDVNGTAAGFSTVVGAWNTGNFFNTDSTGGAGGSVGNVTTSADDLIIKPATTNTGNISVTGAKSVSSITFAPNVGSTVNITGGTSITIGGTGSSSGIFEASSGANKVSTAVILNSTVSAFNFTNTAGGLLTISAVTGAAAGTQTITVGSSAAGGITLNNTIADGGGGGNVALNINSSGAGITTLSGSNTYTGGTTLTAGTVVASNTGALPGYNVLGRVLFNGGTLQVAPVSGWATADIDTLLANAIKTSGKLGLDTTSGSQTQWTAFTGGGNFGGLGLQKAGTNTLTLDQTNTYTGATTVTGGTLQIGSGGTTGSIDNTTGVTLTTGTSLTYNRSDSFTVGYSISGGSANANNVTLLGGGTMTLTGAANNSTYQGRLAVQNGTVSIATWNNGGSAGPLGSGTGNGGQVLLGGTGTTGTLEYTGNTFVTNKALAVNSGGIGVIQIDNVGANVTISGTSSSSGQVTGAGFLVKAGAGTLTLTNNTNSFSGGLTVQQGTLAAPTINNASTAGYLGNNAFITLGGSGQTGTLEVTNGGVEASNMAFVLATGGTGAFQIDNVAENLTLSAIISGNGALAKTGAGTLTLSGLNTYLGNTIVNAGVLSLNNASVSGVLADTANVFLNDGGLGGILNLNADGTVDTVNALYINGVQQAAGLWGAIGSGVNETSFITGSGELLVTMGATPVPEPVSIGALMALGLLGVGTGTRMRRRKAADQS